MFSGVGDTITGGAANAYIDGTKGRMKIAIGSAGSDTVFSGASDTITGGAANAHILGAAGDTVSLAGASGTATINALAGNEAVTLGTGNASVFGAPAIRSPLEQPVRRLRF